MNTAHQQAVDLLEGNKSATVTADHKTKSYGDADLAESERTLHRALDAVEARLVYGDNVAQALSKNFIQWIALGAR